MSHDQPSDDGDIAAEFAELLADVRAHIALESIRGAVVLPAQPLLSRSERLPPRPAGDSQSQPQSPSRRPARGAPPLRAPRFQKPPASEAKVALPSPRPKTQPRRKDPPAQHPAASATPATIGRWGAWTRDSTAPDVQDDPLLHKATSLDEIRSHMGDCKRCGLCEGRSRIVFGVGAASARLMVIGEAPGSAEDRQGEPFVGKAGQMLDRMLQGVLGLQRGQIYIANIVKCRPPGNRNPSADEIARCRPFIDAQLRVIQPDLVLVLGSVAFRTMFGETTGIKRNRGQWRDLDYPGGSARAMSTFHPAYLLRQPNDKRLTFDDLKLLRVALDGLATPG